MKKVLLILFILVPAVIAAVIFTAKDTRFSENENRILKVRSDVSTDVFGGAFQNDLEDYLSDQFPLRNQLISADVNLKLSLGKEEIKGAYAAKDYRLLQRITDNDYDKSACIKFADRVNALASESGIPTYVMYVPSAAASLKSELPKGAPTYDYDGLYSELRTHLTDTVNIDLANSLSSPECYYYSDHHWTEKGIYNAYTEWCRAHSGEAKSFDEYSHISFCKDFHGTLYSKVLSDRIPYDEISSVEISDRISVTADGAPIDLYDLSALDTKDKYNVFEGGNHGVLAVENKDNKSGKTLVIIKDSFANSFLPYIIGDYSKIIMLDDRYTLFDALSMVEGFSPDEIAVIKEIIN